MNATKTPSLEQTQLLRKKYAIAFFLLLVTILFFVNPQGIITKYVIPFGFIMCISFVAFKILKFFGERNGDPASWDGFILNLLVISVVISVIFIEFFKERDNNPELHGGFVINLIIISIVIFAVIFKLTNAGDRLQKNPICRLIKHSLQYLPCVPPAELKMLAISICLLILYFLWFYMGKKVVQTAYLTHGGKQLVNRPVPTDTQLDVATYQSLSDSDAFDYQYAISFWFYLDSFSPSTNASYGKIVPILSYGENPTVKYSSANNTLYITVKQKTNTVSVVDFVQERDPSESKLQESSIREWKKRQSIADAIEDVKSMPFGNEVDSEGHRLIYKHPDVQLQKWNHILINSNGGTLDVFYNGQLVKSAIEVVPYMKYDMLSIGTNNGISGNVANLLYFKQPLDVLTINALYSSMKHENPPSLPENYGNFGKLFS